MTSAQVIEKVKSYSATFTSFCEERGITQAALNTAAEKSAKGSSLLWDEDPFLATTHFVYDLIRDLDNGILDVVWTSDPEGLSNFDNWQFEIIKVTNYSEAEQDDYELRMEQGI